MYGKFVMHDELGRAHEKGNLYQMEVLLNVHVEGGEQLFWMNVENFKIKTTFIVKQLLQIGL